jgi:hypothetical protein
MLHARMHGARLSPYNHRAGTSLLRSSREANPFVYVRTSWRMYVQIWFSHMYTHLRVILFLDQNCWSSEQWKNLRSNGPSLIFQAVSFLLLGGLLFYWRHSFLLNQFLGCSWNLMFRGRHEALMNLWLNISKKPDVAYCQNNVYPGLSLGEDSKIAGG